MKLYVHALAAAAMLMQVGALTACSGSLDDNEPVTDARGDTILNGSPATAFPEAAIVNMMRGGQVVAACSGAVLAPKVILTAGHCVAGFDGWKVTAPYANNQKAISSSASTTYQSTSNQVNAASIDVGLVFLDTPITLGSYPKVATAPVADGSQVVNLGRVRNGVLSSTAVYVSSPIAVSSAKNIGFANDYRAVDKIESGDSGGPDIVNGTHTIVAVNSGVGSNIEVLARVDVVAAWITQQISDHGGPGASTGSTSSAPAGSTGGTGGAGGSTAAGGTSGAGGSTAAGGTSGAGGSTAPLGTSGAGGSIMAPPAAGGATGTTSDPFEAARKACVDQINAFRASVGLPALARMNAQEPCADGQAAKDSQSGTAHSAFQACGEWAQNECPGWPSVASITSDASGFNGQSCLTMMWNEKNGTSATTGHYVNMSSTQYTKVWCGFTTTADGKVWSVQDFHLDWPSGAATHGAQRPFEPTPCASTARTKRVAGDAHWT